MAFLHITLFYRTSTHRCVDAVSYTHLDVKKIATRDSYGAALVELAKDHPDVVVLDADLAAATKTGVFKKAYPDRHFDCGIAESNMMAAAAGMAAMGLVPFASSFAMFAAGRAFEQVRNSIGYPHLNVKIDVYKRQQMSHVCLTKCPCR